MSSEKMESHTAAAELESAVNLARLPAKGRTLLGPYPVWVDAGEGKRQPGVIDGVRLESYDGETNNVMIRLDDSKNPAFWAEVTLNLNKLQQWLREEGVEMTCRPIED